MSDSGYIEIERELHKNLNRIRDAVVNRVAAVAQECYREARAEIIRGAPYDIRAIFHNAVKDWYDAYTPEYYIRKHSIYGVLEVNDDAESLFHDMTTRDARGNSLFDMVFVEGWHGGAFAWGRRAVQTTSAFDLFEGKKSTLEEQYRDKLVALTYSKFEQRFKN